MEEKAFAEAEAQTSKDAGPLQYVLNRSAAFCCMS